MSNNETATISRDALHGILHIASDAAAKLETYWDKFEVDTADADMIRGVIGDLNKVIGLIEAEDPDTYYLDMPHMNPKNKQTA